MTFTQDSLSDVLRFAEREYISCGVRPDSLEGYRADFGGIEQGNPLCVLRPHNVNQLLNLIQSANQEAWTIAIWGGGRSQSGQSLSEAGISLDMSSFKGMVIRGDDSVRCEAGVSWRTLGEYCFPKGLMPYVMPLNLDLSIGGTLSAGGFGAASFKYGSAIAHVLELEVITGAGEHIICTPSQHQDVFNAALGGQGRCGIIIAATIKLRKYQRFTQTCYLLYQTLEPLLHDQHQLSCMSSVTYVEGFTTSTIQGLRLTAEGRQPLTHWQYGLHISFEHHDDTQIHAIRPQVLATLQYQTLLLVEDTLTTEYLMRYDARFQRMRMMKEWGMPHPWFECFIPYEVAPQLISQFLELMPSALGDGHRIFYVPGGQAPPLLMLPECKPVVTFAVLPTAVEPDHLSAVMQMIERFNAILYANGGKRYLSGWMGAMTPVRWQQHYAHHYPYWHRLKAELDPNSVFQSLLFPTSQGPVC